MMKKDKNKNKKNKKFDGKIKTNRDLLIYLFVLIIQNKKWWLLPLLVILAFLSIFINLSGSQSVLPAIYALF